MTNLPSPACYPFCQMPAASHLFTSSLLACRTYPPFFVHSFFPFCALSTPPFPRQSSSPKSPLFAPQEKKENPFFVLLAREKRWGSKIWVGEAIQQEWSPIVLQIFLPRAPLRLCVWEVCAQQSLHKSTRVCTS